MSLNQSDIEKLALLCRINLSPDDSEVLTRRVGDMLALIDQLQEQNTDGIEPMSHPMDAVQHLRSDQITEVDQRPLLMSNAPAAEDGLFLVPKVIE